MTLATTAPTAAAASGAPAPSRRPLPPAAAFAGAASALAALFLAAGAPTPLLVVYQREWGFPASLLTLAFAVYSLGFLAALLVFGSLSDHLGRRPVLVAALLVELAVMLGFAVAPSIGWVIALRVGQGLATGTATAALSAAVVEHAGQRFAGRATVVASAAPPGGLGVGALMSGLAVQLSAHAGAVVFGVLAVVMVAGMLVTVASAETVTRRPGAWRALRPTVSVPRAARAEYAAAIPVHVGSWMLGGLVMSLAPTVVRGLFGVDSGLVNGLTTFLLPASAAVAGFVLGRAAGPRATALLGGAGVVLGAGGVVLAVLTGVLPLLWVSGLVGGLGLGGSFSGAVRLIGPLAADHQRAGLFAAVYVVTYLAFGVPAIVAGVLVGRVGLLDTVLGYAALIVVAAAVGLVTQTRRARGTSPVS